MMRSPIAGRASSQSIADVGGSAARLTLIGLLALAMGGQNAVVCRLAVPDLTTTVLTLTVTGLVADSTPRSVRTRRLISILAMLVGALTGGVMFALGHSRRAALVGGSTAARLCYWRLAGGPPPTIAGLAVAPVSITAASCNRSGYGDPPCRWSASVTTVRSRSPSP